MTASAVGFWPFVTDYVVGVAVVVVGVVVGVVEKRSRGWQRKRKGEIEAR